MVHGRPGNLSWRPGSMFRCSGERRSTRSRRHGRDGEPWRGASGAGLSARRSGREVWDVASEAERLAEGDAETLGRLLNASGALTSAFVDMLGTLGMVPSAKGPSAAFAPQKPVSGLQRALDVLRRGHHAGKLHQIGMLQKFLQQALVTGDQFADNLLDGVDLPCEIRLQIDNA